MTDCTQVPTLDEIYQAKKNITDLDTFTNSTADTFVDSDGVIKATLTGMINAIDWSYIGLFADGVTFTKRSDFAVDSLGTQWIYTGAYPFTAIAGTVPSEPLYQAVRVNSLQQLSGLTEPSDLDQVHTRTFRSINDVNTGSSFVIGQVITVVNATGADHFRKIEASNDGSGVPTANGLFANIVTQNGTVRASWLTSDVTKSYLQSLKGVEFSGESISIALLPTDAIPQFTGYGDVLVTDIYGKIHHCRVENIVNKNSNTGTFSASLHDRTTPVNIGATGDSITDGGDAITDSTQLNPTVDPNDYFNSNLSSTNYNHSANPTGGALSYIAKFGTIATEFSGGVTFNIYNTASSAKNIFSGWAYRNLDYGFFQNAAYGNEIPTHIIACHGMNDVVQLSQINQYKQAVRDYIRKMNFYGAEVLWVLPNRLPATRNYTLQALEEVCASMNVRVIKLYDDMAKLESMGDLLPEDLWKDPNGSIDLIHPNALGHNFLAGALFKEVFKEIVLFADDGKTIDPIRQSGVSYTAGVSNSFTSTNPIYGRTPMSMGFFTGGAPEYIVMWVWADKPTDLYSSTALLYDQVEYSVNCTTLSTDAKTNLPKLPVGMIPAAGQVPIRLRQLSVGLTKVLISGTTGPVNQTLEVPLLHFRTSNVKRRGATTLLTYAPETAPYTTETLYGWHHLDDAPIYGDATTVTIHNAPSDATVGLFRAHGMYVGVQFVGGVGTLKNLINGDVLLALDSTNTFSYAMTTSGVKAAVGTDASSGTVLNVGAFCMGYAPIRPTLASNPDNTRVVATQTVTHNFAEYPKA